MQVAADRIYDIHVLMCEVAVHFIKSNAGMPAHHHIVRVVNNSRAELCK